MVTVKSDFKFCGRLLTYVGYALPSYRYREGREYQRRKTLMLEEIERMGMVQEEGRGEKRLTVKCC